jgi:hypothetical protein
MGQFSLASVLYSYQLYNLLWICGLIHTGSSTRRITETRHSTVQYIETKKKKKRDHGSLALTSIHGQACQGQGRLGNLFETSQPKPNQSNHQYQESGYMPVIRPGFGIGSVANLLSSISSYNVPNYSKRKEEVLSMQL